MDGVGCAKVRYASVHRSGHGIGGAAWTRLARQGLKETGPGPTRHKEELEPSARHLMMQHGGDQGKPQRLFAHVMAETETGWSSFRFNVGFRMVWDMENKMDD